MPCILGAHRPAEVVTLYFIATTGLEEDELRSRFDPLGNDAYAEVMGKVVAVIRSVG